MIILRRIHRRPKRDAMEVFFIRLLFLFGIATGMIWGYGMLLMDCPPASACHDHLIALQVPAWLIP